MSLKKSRARIWIEIIVAISLLIGLFAWSEGLFRKKILPAGASAGLAPWTGRTVLVEERSIPMNVEASGSVRGRNEAVISARVMGVIERIAVREGERVKKGDLLVVLMAPELAAGREAAAGGESAAIAAVEQARRDYARMDALHQEGATSRAEWERARTGLEQAEAARRAARGSLAAASSVAAFTRLRAPFAGVVSARHYDPGATVAPGIPILDLTDDASFRVEATLDEENATGLAPGDSVVALVAAANVEKTVALAAVVPSSDPATRTVLLVAELGSESAIRSGQFARLRVVAGERRGLVVPAAMVRRAASLATVRVLGPENVPLTRHVWTGALLADGSIEILSGLKAGERVVVE
jgi:RND family efflux transporter MFP subunit